MNRISKSLTNRVTVWGFILTLMVVLTLVSDSNGAVFGLLGEKAWETPDSSAVKDQLLQAAYGNSGYPLACGERPDDVDQTNYDVLMYDIYIKLAKADPDYILGRVTCLALITSNNTDTIAIDLAADMFIDSVYSPAGRLGIKRDGEVVLFALGASRNIGDTIEITTVYEGQPSECGLLGFDFEQHKDRTASRPCISSLSQPSSARSWWPCKDRMDDKADSFKIAVQIPTDEDREFICVSNGRRDSVVAHGDTSSTYFYTESHPMATYLFALAISDYNKNWEDRWIYNNGLDTMPVFFYTWASLGDIAVTWSVIPELLDSMSSWFGLYPFADEKYGHVNTQAGYAIEHQTISSFPWKMALEWDTLVVVHELAHQWWGNMITCESWHHSWLNEGWAKYSEALWREVTGGAYGYHALMDTIRCTDTTRSVYVEDTTDIIWDVFYEPLVYDKGAWVLHMLRHKLGDSLFWIGVDAYYNSKFKWGSANTDDMRDVFDNATGVDLETFFQQWIYDKGYPVYEWSYIYVPDRPSGSSSDLLAQLYVHQMDEKGRQRFEMPVDFVFHYANGDSDVFRFDVDSIDNWFTVRVADSIEFVVLDPDQWVLHEDRQIEWIEDVIVTRGNSHDPTITLSHGVADSSYNDTIYTTVGVGNCSFTLTADSLPERFEFDNSTGIITLDSCIQLGKWEFTVTAIFSTDPLLTDIATMSLTIDSAITLPDKFRLHANYPNPFNTGTLIEFDLPRPAFVSLSIYNVLGQKVRTLINRHYEAGIKHVVTWYGDNDGGQPVATGVYFYRLTTDGQTQTRKMLLIK
ncbi:MAG: T9SS type A sorting domain-containing protein [candidate division Zixibacteria bacterium]|nr:T9SS type A sorting domain-containing protein [candidate division Zixibacteria bacterium]